ncbi:MAG: hypothetical protein NTX24_00625 [Candidatus Pacearchaeota archaeon]|nr:hypothetical protein [Candidatus Pacearchaeota archaeon]
MADYNPKDFILEFFKDCKINDKEGVLTISEVPRDFEEFIGKKPPYKLVFDFNLHAKVKDSELVIQGSYFLLGIRDYLRNKGQTSLLKLDIKPDLLELSKNPKLKNYKILEIKPGDYNFLSEFSFLSIYQYLNEKKQTIIKFLVKDREILDWDIHKFKTHDGNKEEIPFMDLKEPYNLAKKRLDMWVNKEIKVVKYALNAKLSKELNRIKDHYSKQIKEKDEEVERCKEKIKLLESKLKHTYYDRDINILKRTIQESKARLEMLQKRSYQERLNAEEIFHINDEIEKHALSIKNILINTTLCYYPVYNILILSKGKKISKKYDPVLKIFI